MVHLDVNVLWSNFLEQIKEELNSLSFKTWFTDTSLYKIEEGKAYIIVPMAIHKRHLVDSYGNLITSMLSFTSP